MCVCVCVCVCACVCVKGIQQNVPSKKGRFCQKNPEVETLSPLKESIDYVIFPYFFSLLKALKAPTKIFLNPKTREALLVGPLIKSYNA